METKTINGEKKVYLRIVAPLKLDWTCPNCSKVNLEYCYSVPKTMLVQCDKCGLFYSGVR